MRKPRIERQVASWFMSAALILSALGNFVACAPESADLTGYMAPPPPPAPPKPPAPKPPPLPPPDESVIQKANLQGPGDTKLDILFVVDTSYSMCSDKDRLRDNIAAFVDEFAKNKKIDFHIGVTASYDSARYRLYGRNDVPNGALRPIVGQPSSKRYVSLTTPNYVQALKDSIPLEPEGLTHDPTTGPATEELFSPVLASFDPGLQNGLNKGFRRPDAHFVVVIFSDTDDLSPSLSASSFTTKLKTLLETPLQGTGKSVNLITLAALARYNEMVNNLPEFSRPFPQPAGGSNVCSDEDTVDPDLAGAGRGPKRIVEFLSRTGGSAFDLNRDKNVFGSRMAGFAKFIVRKTLSYDIDLDEPYDPAKVHQMIVSINGRTLRQDPRYGYSVFKGQNGKKDSIRIHKDAQIGEELLFDVLITYIKAKPTQN